METDRFDTLSRRLAGRVSRRTAVRGTATGLAASALGLTARRANAQEATPAVATPGAAKTVHPEARSAEKQQFLFAQTFESGSWAPKAGAKDTYSLTLSGASAETAYFSDRPERIVGLSPTNKFLKGLGFTPANPPNAALVAAPTGEGDQDVLVIELFNPAYDAKAKTLTYDAKILKDYQGTGIALLAQQQQDYDFAADFGGGGLFIDGCQDGSTTCYMLTNNQQVNVGEIQNVGCCFQPVKCDLCNGDPQSAYYGKLCADAFPSQCNYQWTGNGMEWNCYAQKPSCPGY